MTREEAISIMNVIVHMLEPQYDTDRIEDAVEMAIKALEQELCDDAKSETVTEFADRCRECGAKYGKLLKQKPKIGYWRPIYQGDEIIDYRCSECEFGYTFGKSTYGMNYCPKCGAKMERSDKE